MNKSLLFAVVLLACGMCMAAPAPEAAPAPAPVPAPEASPNPTVALVQQSPVYGLRYAAAPFSYGLRSAIYPSYYYGGYASDYAYYL